MMESVYILNALERTPTFHGYGRIVQLDIARNGDATKCGRVIYDGAVKYDALLRRDHAQMFARPCAICFPREEADE